MICISGKSGLVTLINVFSCESSGQGSLIKAWQEGTNEELGSLPGIVSSALHRSLDGTRVVNYAQWRSAEDWENLTKVGRANDYFARMGRFGRPDAHLYEVVYTLDRTGTPI
jgi:hypothetical protein